MLSSTPSAILTSRKGSTIMTAHVLDGKVVTRGSTECSPQLSNLDKGKPISPLASNIQIPVIKFCN